MTISLLLLQRTTPLTHEGFKFLLWDLELSVTVFRVRGVEIVIAGNFNTHSTA